MIPLPDSLLQLLEDDPLELRIARERQLENDDDD